MIPFPSDWSADVDAYQVGHFELIPPGMEDFQCSQGVFRKPLRYGGDERADHRLMAAGTRIFIETCLKRQLTLEGIDETAEFLSTFHADTKPPFCKPYPFPKEMLKRVVTEFGGYLPVVLLALPDGQAHYVGEPHVQVFCDVPGMGELVGWIESSMLPYQWVSSIVATRGRVRKDAYIDEYAKVYRNKTRDELHQMVAYKFHDFGRRGGASTQISGIAHLMNWLGTDTIDAARAAWKYLNNKKPFGACSVMAAAHRTVTPWPTEDQSIRNAISKFGNGILSFVADSYDYARCLEALGSYAEVIKVRGGFLVGRPDSGDPVSTVLEGLTIFAKAFGIDEAQTAEASGMRVIQNASILQGDGVSDRLLFEQLFPAVRMAGFSPSNLVVGMGEYNHRAVRSDTEDGYKTAIVGTPRLSEFDTGQFDPRCYDKEGRYRKTMKGSKNLWKMSIPCPVAADFSGAAKGAYSNRIQPITIEQLQAAKTGDLVCYYDGRAHNMRKVVISRDLFQEDFIGTRARAWSSWDELLPIVPDTFDREIREMQDVYLKQQGASLDRA